MSSPPGPVIEFVGRVLYEIESMRPLFPTYLHLLVSAIFPIYTAAHASLSRPPSAAPRKREKATPDDEDPDDDESQKIETLTPSDAIVFPLLAGATLATLYFILKWLQDPAWLNWILGIYFSQMGLLFSTKFLKDMFTVLRSFLLPRLYSTRGAVWKVDQRERCFKTEGGETSNSALPGFLRMIPLPSSLSRRLWTTRGLLYTKARLDFHVLGVITVKGVVEFLDVVSLVLSCAIVYYHAFISKPWFLTNFLGFSFCYGSLQFMTPTTAWTGTLVLGALFFYDIYFVFFTPMMVTVATKLDVPIKLLFPRPNECVFPVGAPQVSQAMEEYLQCMAKERTMAMLGLGDIVVPGMMLAFALRFDLYLYYLRQNKSGAKPSDEPQGDEKQLPTYVNAQGNWGERFWTRSKLWPVDIKGKRFPKPYFYATISGYLAGMVTTVVVMQVAKHAQPALLYLVPGVLLSLWGTALLKGDLKALWRYSEMPETDDGKKDGNKKAEKDSTKSIGDAADKTKSIGTTGDNAEGGQVAQVDTKVTDPGKSEHDATKKEDGDHRRRLIYFSITLPDLPPGEEGAGDKAHPESTGSTPEMNGAANKTVQRSDDGEPLVKRARKA